jgi:hypothetical protein
MKKDLKREQRAAKRSEKNELKNFLIQQYGFTIAFVQSGF